MNLRKILLPFFVLALGLAAQAQPGFSVDIKKEKPFEERKLKAEKTGEGPIKTPKRIFTNLTTRYNYVFNANNKFREILERAKAAQQDDFSQLLTFYPYTLEATAADSAQLDSVIYKCRTGIVNHDLRNEWGDELYLLWAASWHLQKKLDSASLMLQFINYAYAPQDEYGYYSYIGSRKEGSQELSIATKEDKKFLHSNTFGRNNAFLWQIRTLVEMGNFASSGSLITTLKRDPVFPKRLFDGLAEAEAYWYYKQGRWDSAAVYLMKALDGAETKREKARWQYLIAQMLERSGQAAQATEYYTKAVSSTPDPVMEVYGRLNLVRISKEGGENAVDKNVAELLKMARRDKYEEYRDVIYYMAAQMEMERNNVAAAQDLLMKGAKYNNGNGASRSKAFLRLADVSFDQKNYVAAAAFYDSIQLADLLPADAQRVDSRKPALKVIADNAAVLARQDSLQRIAAMPKEAQENYIKQLVKRLRKEQGLKEETAPTAGRQSAAAPPADLFSASGKGEWYFYNTASRTQGANEFKQVWGNRPNVDNWRRFAVVSQQLLARDPMNTGNGAAVNDLAGGRTIELTVEGLTANLPVTAEAVNRSNDSIKSALQVLGLTYLNDLEDYPSAIAAFEEIRKRFPDATPSEAVLFNLQYAYTKAGNAAQAAQVKRLLQEKYPSSRYTAILTTGKDPQAKTDKSPEATKAYEDVYNQFIEGRFAEAIAAKRIADSTYKTTFWQPQLLYIEAVYYIKQREDSTAAAALQTIVRQNSNDALTNKAQNLLSVLSRRRQIEDELNRYQMQGAGADSANTASANTATVVAPPLKKDSAVVKTPSAKDSTTAAKLNADKQAKDSVAKSIAAAKAARDLAAKAKADSIAGAKAAAKAVRDSLAKAVAQAKLVKDSIAKAKADSIVARRAADKAFKDSVAQAARDSIAKRTDAAKWTRDSTARARADSIAKRAAAAKAAKDSMAKAAKDSADKKAAAAKAIKDSTAKAIAAARVLKDSLAKAEKDSLAKRAAAAKAARDSTAKANAAAKAARDTAVKKPVVPKPNSIYTYVPEAPHTAVIVLEKVDPVFVNEARNAFFRFNRERYVGQSLDAQILSLTADTKLLLVSGFANAQAAVDYAERVRALAPREIIPWLTGNKYTFTVISSQNLEVLKTTSDINAYKKFLEQYLPGKF